MKNKRGVLLIEYALLLAFVVLVSAIFISDNGMTNSITGIFTKTEKLLGSATSSDTKKTSGISGLIGESFTQNGYWNATGTISSDNNFTMAFGNGSENALFYLEPGKQYTMKLDISDISEDDLKLIQNISIMGFNVDTKAVDRNVGTPLSGNTYIVCNDYRQSDYEQLTGDGISIIRDPSKNTNGYYYGINVTKRTHLAKDPSVDITDSSFKYSDADYKRANELLNQRLTIKAVD